MNTIDLDVITNRLDQAQPRALQGRVRSLKGLVIRASLPDVVIGDVAVIDRRDGSHLLAEAVGFSREDVVLMPLDDPTGVGPDSPIASTGRPLCCPAGESLTGRVLDGLGQPIDGKPLELAADWPVVRPAPRPMDRRRIENPLATGVRALDALTTLGEGQRIGLFAGSGVGKTTLLGQLARHSDADVAVVCLVGERGREVLAFIEDALGPGLSRSVVVAATADSPAMVRVRAAHTGTAIAEWFRAQGARVLLLMDSVTRVARAQRMIGLACGEPPTRRGFPPSVFHELPRLVERAGIDDRGSITGVYTVLIEGDDMREPIADEMRATLDGHVVLSRELAERAHFPAIDALASLSRTMPRLVAAQHLEAAKELRRLLAVWRDKRDLVLLGAYEAGTDPLLDDALELADDIEALLVQPLNEQTNFTDTVARLVELVGEPV